MKTIERTEEPVTAHQGHDTTSRSGHIGRITAISMTTGAVAAVTLAVGVFGRSTEPVTTGVVLLAFASSWWMLAALARRRTNQPQHWARVPATVMALLGVVTLALRPSATAMSAAGWVWPVGLITLAVWMIVQSRRSMRSRARRVVLYPIFGLMIAGGIAGAHETVREAQDNASYAMPGDLVDVGGHRLHIDCTGTGSPTVVLEAGLGEPSTIMAGWIAPAVSPTTRVCVYDRAGKGWSDAAPDDHDPLAALSDLHTLLDHHGETGPFVLAGHSSGGVYAQAFAATYPDDVAGLVLLDSQPADALTRLPGYSSQYTALGKASGVAPSAARFGVMRLVNQFSAGSLPEDRRAEERAFGSTASQARSMRDEIVALPTAMERARTLTSLGDKPLVVVSAERDAMDGWMPLQAEMTELSTNSVQRVVSDASHSSLIEDERDAANGSAAIHDVVRSVRTHTALATEPAASNTNQPAPAVVRPTDTVDQLVEVDGARMHVRCHGAGPATVVLMSGFETSSNIWAAVAPAVSQRSRVCSYDKFGTGTSDPAPTAQTFATQADDLHSALGSLGEPGPFLVVGHSFGGSEAVTFAAKHPTDVRGVVLVDASPTGWQSAICAVPDGAPGGQRYRQICSMTSSPAANAELLDGPEAFAEVGEIDSLGQQMPLVVITAAHHSWGLEGGEEARLNEVWNTGQDHWLSLSSTSRLVPVEDTSHNIQVDQPAVVIDQIVELLP